MVLTVILLINVKMHQGKGTEMRMKALVESIRGIIFGVPVIARKKDGEQKKNDGAGASKKEQHSAQAAQMTRWMGFNR
jgi:hypothetical protein